MVLLVDSPPLWTNDHPTATTRGLDSMRKQFAADSITRHAWDSLHETHLLTRPYRCRRQLLPKIWRQQRSCQPTVDQADLERWPEQR